MYLTTDAIFRQTRLYFSPPFGHFGISRFTVRLERFQVSCLRKLPNAHLPPPQQKNKNN